ncbi:MAG: hypothetical protein Q8M26_00610 [Pseudolabrys sp.]|nr:hypothetical protein [Pseudolabrys sp.]
MKLAPLALATALAATLGFAPNSFAQSSDRDDRGSAYQSDRGNDRDQGDEDWRGDRAQSEDRDRDSRRGRGRQAENGRDDGPREQYRGRHYRGAMGYHMGHMGRMAGGPMQRGARFKIESGDARIDIQCPAQVEVQSCVQAAGHLLDRIGKRDDGTKPSPGTSGSGGSLETSPDTAAPPSRM